MNKFIVTVEFFPFVMGKNKRFKVETKLTKKDVCNIITERETKENEYYEVYVVVETIDEYLADIEVFDVDGLILKKWLM